MRASRGNCNRRGTPANPGIFSLLGHWCLAFRVHPPRLAGLLPKKNSSVLLLLACGLAVAGCADPRTRAEAALQRVGAEQVRQDAALLYKDTFAGRGTDFLVLRRSSWPPSFERFQPLRVGAYPDGFSLAIKADADTEAGLYIVPLHMEHVPTGPASAHFHRLAEGVYWYSFEK